MNGLIVFMSSCSVMHTVTHNATSAPMQSIKSYFSTDDDFNWDHGLALAATGKYREAEEALGAVQNEKYRFVHVATAAL